jgi:hypothetical protein
MDWMATPFPTWEDVAWLAELWHGPLMVKGIPQPDDARRAVDAGATAIGVSNHGGNNLDTTPSPLRYLPSAVDAVGDQAEITFDSGIRRGADVVKVLALGAKAALVGRSWFFGECLVQVVSIDAVVPQVAACAVLAGDSWTRCTTTARGGPSAAGCACASGSAGRATQASPGAHAAGSRNSLTAPVSKVVLSVSRSRTRWPGSSNSRRPVPATTGVSDSTSMSSSPSDSRSRASRPQP